MNRIAKISLIFRILFQVMLIALPLFTVISWIMLPDQVGLGINHNMISYSPIPEGLQIEYLITPGVKVLGFLISMLTVSTGMFIFYQLVRLFKNYENEKIFSLKNVRLIRNVGYALIIWQVLVPISKALLSVILTWDNGPGHRMLETSLSSTNIAVIIIAFIVILISWVMAEGHKLQEEQEYTV